MDYTELLRTLQKASPFQLYRLRALITDLLDDPQWTSVVQSRLRVGQSVEYFEAKHNCLHKGTIEELRTKHAVILDADGVRRWLVQYAAINVSGEDIVVCDNASRGISPSELSVGDLVGFPDRSGDHHCGHVIRRNAQTATINVAGHHWRVSYEFLYRVVSEVSQSSGDNTAGTAEC